MLIDYAGKNVFVRTVTHYYTGRLDESLPDGFLVLHDAAWIGDTGRFADALASGSLSEVEPYPGDCLVALGAVVDLCEWPHDLPREQR